MAGNTEYTRGEMDIAEQTSTFHLVMGLTKWVSLAMATVILWATLLFCTDTGFIGSVVSALVVAGLGVLLLREKPAAAH